MGGGSLKLSAPAALAVGWSHVAVVVGAGGSTTVFVDGVSVPTMSIPDLGNVGRPWYLVKLLNAPVGGPLTA